MRSGPPGPEPRDVVVKPLDLHDLRPRLQRGAQRLAGRSRNQAAVALLRLGLPFPPYTPETALVMETFGRKSGKRRLTPMGYLRESPDRLLVVAEHGRAADWLRNALAGGTVQVWLGGRPHRGRVSVVEGADPAELIARMGNRLHAAAIRLMSHEPRVVAIDVEPDNPTC